MYINLFNHTNHNSKSFLFVKPPLPQLAYKSMPCSFYKPHIAGVSPLTFSQQSAGTHFEENTEQNMDKGHGKPLSYTLTEE